MTARNHVSVWRVTPARPARPVVLPTFRLRAPGADIVKAFDLRAKANWSDDQGFRVSPTRIAFKGHF